MLEEKKEMYTKLKQIRHIVGKLWYLKEISIEHEALKGNQK